MTWYLILIYLLSLVLGYVLAFTQTTLEIGKSLSDAGSPRGYQDAVTPPQFSGFAILTYVLSLGGVIYGFWEYGWVVGIGVFFGLFFTTAVNIALILPKINGPHFRNIVVHSMINRHADYLKSNDTLRASIMAELLTKLGIPVQELIARIKRDDGA